MTTVLRKLLDELMGQNRNGDKADALITDFRDPRVCKNYLLGLCPHDLFTNTKEDLGPCGLVHEPRLKAAYEAACASVDYGFDVDLERRCEKLIADAERKISKGRERVSDEQGVSDGFIPRIDIDSAPEVLAVTQSTDAAVIEAQEARAAGDEEKAARIEEELEGLTRRKAEMMARLLLSKAADDAAGAANRQRLRVCDVCGAYLSLNDSEERIADHFGGRVHLGFLAIRQKLKNIREWRSTVRAAAHAAAPPSATPARDQAPMGYSGASHAGYGDRAPAAPSYPRAPPAYTSAPRYVDRDRGYDRDRGGYDRDRDRDRGYDRGGYDRGAPSSYDRGAPAAYDRGAPAYDRGGGSGGGYDRDRDRDRGGYSRDARPSSYGGDRGYDRGRDGGRRDDYRDRY